ncbi:MAG: Signal peptide peptidase SppA (protease 4) [uncultured Sphingomonas sp.]|uniref:Signal peptide peptidase SppA (Protease 4) n=1 Tax=uncultured Sphingomonas sp. TaxID=158754 RepID=A0A6J4SRS0_9SPHN|nr:signal peptide peptidase SppA [uncultured Sphingomonas sp.]CAA9503537.1 MAG: Signal peptide peptidase SppA (protease 4) [uncultured Sphingomonas sp.]
MRFAAGIWKLLVGIKDALVLLFMLLFFGLLYAVLSAKPSPAVADGVLALELNGSVVEQPTAADPFAAVGGGSAPKEYSLRQLRTALTEAAEDDRVKAVALDLDRFGGGGQTAIAELGEALDGVRRSGKPVLAYATAYGDDAYQLAAHASEVWLNPLGTVALAGPGGNNLYFKGLLDKLGVTANIYRVGTYKSAVEPFTRNDMSPEARQNAQELAGNLLETWRDDLRRARPRAAIEPYLRDTAGIVAASGGDFAAAARRAGLVDRVGERRQFEARLAELGGEDERARGGYKKIAIAAYVADRVPLNPGGPIGVVTVAGNIVDGKAPLGTAGGDSIAQAVEKGLRSGKLKALVVRIDSPGGSVTASERIRQAVVQARAAGLPVVASMGNVAASGGYWVAAGADHIMAEPSTITGSIGVFGILPSFQGSLEKLGIGADGVKTTPLSGEPDLLNGPSPQASRLVQMGVEGIYRRFLGLVAQSRGRSPQQIDQVAQGRVWAGGTARQLGLVDSFGGMDEAIAKAAQLAKLGDERGVTYLERPTSWREEVADLFRDTNDDAGTTDAFAGLAVRERDQLFGAAADVRTILSGPTLQVRCLECPPVAPARIAAADAGVLGAMLGWLR